MKRFLAILKRRKQSSRGFPVGWWIVGILVGTVGKLCAAEPMLPEYQLGQVAQAEILAPVAFSVTNAGETKRLQELEARNTPPIYRYCPSIADQTVRQFEKVLAEYRLRFLTNLVAAAEGKKLNPESLKNASFVQYLAWYQEWNPEFPLSADLARIWALKKSDRAWASSLAKALRAGQQGNYITPNDSTSLSDSLPIRMVPVESLKQPLDLRQVERKAAQVKQEDLLTLEQARKVFEDRFEPNQKPFARFLSRFLQVNCIPDLELTAADRAQRMAAMVSLEHYSAGQAILSAGQRVDAKALAALAVLRSREIPELAVSDDSDAAPSKVENEEPPSRVGLMTLPGKAKELHQRHPWLWLIWPAMILGLLGWLFRKRKTRAQKFRYLGGTSTYATIRRPGSNESILLPFTGRSKAASSEEWPEEIRVAEKRTEELMVQVKAGLAPQLARELLDGVVQEILEQRRQLLDSDQTTEEDVSMLEQRLARLQEQWEQRLRAYEKRPTDLGKQVDARKRDNRNLIQSQLPLMLDKPPARRNKP